MLHRLSLSHLLRQSVPSRLAIALLILSPLWLAIYWAVLLP